jgi:hypothetical protein
MGGFDSTDISTVGLSAIGFEYTPLQPFQLFAGLGWQPKDRNGKRTEQLLDMDWTFKTMWIRGAVSGARH